MPGKSQLVVARRMECGEFFTLGYFTNKFLSDWSCRVDIENFYATREKEQQRESAPTR